MLLGLETFSYHLALSRGAMDVFGFIGRVAELGLDGVQINIVQQNWGHLGGGEPEHLQAVRDLVESRGLFIELDTRGTAPEHLRAALAVCSAVGADVLRTYASLGGDLAEELRQAVDDLRAVVPDCAAHGVRIAFENHEYETADDIVQVLDAVDSEWVGALVDTGNGMMVWEPPTETVRKLAPWAASTHFKDHLVTTIEGQPMVVGTTLGRGRGECAACHELLATQSDLQRLNIECCYGYQAPFRRPMAAGAGGRLGEGAFEVLPGPFDSAVLDPRHHGGQPAIEDLLRLHDAAVVESVAYVKGLRGAGDRAPRG